MLILYFALVRSKVEYASVVWISITSTDQAQDRDQWRALVNTVMNFRVP
jgi:hypothetical protein